MTGIYNGTITGQNGAYGGTSIGGAGGSGISLTGDATISSSGIITGGSGGQGGKVLRNGFTLGAAGGLGGYGVYLAGSVSVVNYGAIDGGAGGLSGIGGGGYSYYPGYGIGGIGGGGLRIGSDIGASFINKGTISGGVGGNGPRAGAAGGVGVVLDGGSTLDNAGLILGGAGGTSTRYGGVAGGGAGVVLYGTDHVTNTGTMATSDNFALKVGGASTIVNATHGVITAASGGTVTLANGLTQTYSVYFDTASSGASLVNGGMISGTIGEAAAMTTDNLTSGTIGGSVDASAGSTLINAGTVTGSAVLSGAGDVQNSGSLQGISLGNLSGTASGTATLANTGSLGGVYDAGGQAVTISNRSPGVIGAQGGSGGYAIDIRRAAAATVVNDGTLIGQIQALYESGVPFGVTNTGDIGLDTFTSLYGRTAVVGGIDLGGATAGGAAALLTNSGMIAGGVALRFDTATAGGAALVMNQIGGTIIGQNDLTPGLSISGVLTGTTATPVYIGENFGLIDGGTSGGTGVSLYHAAGSFMNAGTIVGGAASSYGAVGNGLSAAGATVINAGTILGGAIVNATTASVNVPSGGAGVSALALINHGTVTGGNVGIHSSYAGGMAVTQTQYILNTGLIEGGVGGGIVSTKYIGGYSLSTFGVGGIAISETSGTIDNQGSIAGGYGADAVTLGYGTIGSTLINSGDITGGAGGSTMAGGVGVQLGGSPLGTTTPYDTIINAGTISGGTNGGAGAGIAVNVGYSDELALKPGSTIIGNVAYGGSTTAPARGGILALMTGQGQGTLGGIGDTFVPFPTITFDTGASWQIEGAASALAPGPNAFGQVTPVALEGFNAGDTIILDGFAATADSFVSGTGLELTDATGTITLDLVGSFTTADFVITDPPGNTTIALASPLPCFAAGTRLLTTTGERQVEDLGPGEQMVLHGGGVATIIWIGRRRLDLRRHPRRHTVCPVQIDAGAICDGVPRRNLLVSPDHAIFLDGCLIPAKCLENGTTIRQVNPASVTYYHVELQDHAILYAEGCPAESYLETGNRGAFENGGAAMSLHPDLAQMRREVESCARFVTEGVMVQAVRRRLLARAKQVMTADPGLKIRYRRDGAAVIHSRTAIPGLITEDPRDRRQLGVKIAELVTGRGRIRLDHPLLVEGWHDPESDGRWTSGSAVLPGALLAGQRDLRVSVSATLSYPLAHLDPAGGGSGFLDRCFKLS